MRKRLTPGVVLGIVALVVAMTGSAVGASLITGKQVKNSSLTGKDVKDKSLTKKDFKGSVLGARGLPGAPGPAGAPGAAGAPGPAGADALANLGGVAASTTVTHGTVDGGTLDCPDGQTVVSGGFEFDATDGEVYVNEPTPDGTGWTALGDNLDSADDATLAVIA